MKEEIIGIFQNSPGPWMRTVKEMEQEYTIKEEAKEKHFIKHFNCIQWSQEVNKDQDSETAIGFGKKRFRVTVIIGIEKTLKCSVGKSCLTLGDLMGCSMPCFPVLHCLPKFAQTHVHWVDDVIQSFHPLLPPSPPALNLYKHQGLSNELTPRIRWPKYWSFSISPFNEYSQLISFRMDWFDLPAVQGTLKSLLQYHNSKGSILWHSGFCMVQLTSVDDYWKKHNFGYMDHYWQNNVSAF